MSARPPARKQRPQTEKELAEREEAIRLLFDSIDVNGDKILQTAELKQALREFRIPDENLSKFYIPSDHSVDYAEFRELILLHDDAMRSTFDELSMGEPVISFEHFRDGLRKNSPLAKHLDDATLHQLFNRIDTNHNGTINYVEFVAALYVLPEISVGEAMKQFERSQWFHVNEMTTLSNSAPISFIRSAIDWNSVMQALISGGIAGGVSRTATAPLDRLKYMRQVGRSVGVIDGIQKVYAEGGMVSFFRGNGVNCMKVIPEHAMKFVCFETLKPFVTHDPKKGIQVHERLIAGATAGAIAQSIVYPLETIKTRLATTPGAKMTILQCSKILYREAGVLRFYSGLSATLIGVLPYAGIDLAIYDSLRSWATRRLQRRAAQTNSIPEAPGTAIILGCSMISGSVAQFFSYPAALVRTKLQVLPRGTTIRSIVSTIYSTQGVKGFYAGMVPNAAKALPATMLSYWAYEHSRHYYAYLRQFSSSANVTKTIQK